MIQANDYITRAKQIRNQFKGASDEMRRRAQAALYTYWSQAQLVAALQDAGLSIDEFVRLGPEVMTEFFALMPSLDVDTNLIMYRDKHRGVEANDLHDIALLAVTVPYCDAVFVEKFWASALRNTGLADRYETRVSTNLAEMVDIVNGLLAEPHNPYEAPGCQGQNVP